jgi:hypothetical protein
MLTAHRRVVNLDVMYVIVCMVVAASYSTSDMLIEGEPALPTKYVRMYVNLWEPSYSSKVYVHNDSPSIY